MKIDAKKLRKYHRWIGLIFSVTILMSAGSGVIHTIMSRTQPPPPKAAPSAPIAVDEIVVGVKEAFGRIPSPSGDPVSVSFRPIDGKAWYQFILEGHGKPSYVSADEGHFDPAADERYARQIAEAYLGGKPVKAASYLEAFDQEYINIFRILPVYRFDAVDDARHTRLYVSTMTGSVTRATDDAKQWEASIFTNIHKFNFIPNKDLRDAVLVGVTIGAFLVSLAGLCLFVLT